MSRGDEVYYFATEPFCGDEAADEYADRPCWVVVEAVQLSWRNEPVDVKLIAGDLTRAQARTMAERLNAERGHPPAVRGVLSTMSLLQMTLECQAWRALERRSRFA